MTEIVIKSVKTLSMRDAAELVGLAEEYAAKITLRIGADSVNAKSVMGVIALGIGAGREINVAADGGDEAGAVDAIRGFLGGE